MRRILAIILAASAIASLCACSLIGSTKTIDSKEKINSYIMELMDVDIGDYFAENEMELTKENSEEYAMIRIRLKPDTVEKVEEILGMKISKDPGDYVIPGYQDHPYAQELKMMEQRSHFQMFTSGNRVKTRDINVYIAKDKGGYYLYIFG